MTAQDLFREGEKAQENKDDASALQYYRQAAEQGHPDAQCKVGVAYERGLGAPEDRTLAVSWFQKAADNGSIEAAYCLGVSYREGRGIPKDLRLAAHWLQHAAKKGDDAAKAVLRRMKIDRAAVKIHGSPAELKAKLEAEIRPLLRSISLLQPLKTQTNALEVCRTRFGGFPYAEAGEEWPLCNQCHNPQTFLGQFISPSGEADHPVLWTFYCCLNPETIWESPWTLRRYDSFDATRYVLLRPSNDSIVLPFEDVREIQAQSLPFMGKRSPRGPLKSIFNLCAALAPEKPETYYDALRKRLNIVTAEDEAHYLGGYPNWLQGEEIPACSSCNQPMNFLGQWEAAQWIDEGIFYFFQCQKSCRKGQVVYQR